MEIVGDVKNYAWGKLGCESVVAQLASLNETNIKIESDKTYSELWMGTHPSGPAVIKNTGEILDSLLKRQLPFLFKVLSIRTALSIQVHPNKAEAIRLHKERPDIYKDPNHKPELAIALTPFLALCGFRPYEDIYKFCKDLPPLYDLLGGEDVVGLLRNGSSTGLRECFEKLMNSSIESTIDCVKCISNDYSHVLKSSQLLDIYNTMNRDFPNDIGILSLFFLNLVRLEPGEAIFLGANEIHAYLDGDCIECMACSDNVIRAGLTPKYKDVKQLIACLNYDGQPAESKLFQPVHIDNYLKVFAPPVEDFAVQHLLLPPNKLDYKMNLAGFDVIILVLNGERCLKYKTKTFNLVRGSILFIPSDDAAIEFSLNSEAKDDFVAYIASYNYFIDIQD